MKNLTVQQENKQVEEVIEDPHKILSDLKGLVDNCHYQNKDIRKGVYFISEEELTELPKQLTLLINQKLSKN